VSKPKQSILKQPGIQAAGILLLLAALLSGMWVWQGFYHRQQAYKELGQVQATFGEFKQLQLAQAPAIQLDSVAKKLGQQDTALMADMTYAKQHKRNIKDLVHKLCDSLEDQMAALQQSKINQSVDSIHGMWQTAELVESGIDRAMSW
jgi:hypothetical protein